MSTKPVYVQASDGFRALQVKGHTREKLFYISRYVDQFCTATKGRWPVRNYIDLFSGPGLNVDDDKGEEIKSASLTALSHKFPCTNYFLNDIDRESINALRSRIELVRLGQETRVHVTSADCNAVVDSVVATIGRVPSVNLAVLDGFGIECHWSTVKKLASVQRMDLIILFPGNMTVVRNADRWSLEEDAQLDLFMPTKDWRQVWNDRRLGGSSATGDLLKLYVNGLRQLSYEGDDLIRTQLIKSESGQPLYHLIFASRHPLGSKFWKQATGRDDEGQMSLPF